MNTPKMKPATPGGQGGQSQTSTPRGSTPRGSKGHGGRSSGGRRGHTPSTADVSMASTSSSGSSSNTAVSPLRDPSHYEELSIIGNGKNSKIKKVFCAR